MPVPTNTTGANPELTLVQLEDWLWGQESAFGPVIAIGNNGHSTAATFTFDLLEPTTKANLLPDSDEAPPDRARVCGGTVFVEGEKLKVNVWR